jgi:hypothetical protein
LVEELFLIFKNVSTSQSFSTPHYQLDLKPFLNYLKSIVCRQSFIIIFFEKKCALYPIKYGILNVYDLESEKQEKSILGILAKGDYS